MSPCFIRARNKHKQGEIFGCNSKSALLPYFEKVQHPKEKSRAKTYFAKVIRAVAKIYK